MRKSVFSLLWKLSLPCLLAFGLQKTFVHLVNFPVAEAKSAPGLPTAGSCVNPGGTGGCYNSIQAAINAANPGDIVSVSTGTYREHITMKNQVSVYGAGMFNTVIDGGYSNAQSTVYFSGISAGTVLSGVQVTGGGLRNISGSSLQDGGGIYIGFGDATVNNTWVYSCTARWGGGIYIQYAKATLNNVSVTSSRAKENGGGINITGDKEVKILANPFDITQGLIMLNTASQGAGIYASSTATLTIAGMHFFLNTASGPNGYGGGILLQNSTGKVYLAANNFNNNTAKIGAGLYSAFSTQLDIGLNTFDENIATQDSGGVNFISSSGEFHHNWVRNNRTNLYGGGITYVGNSHGPTLRYNWIEGNRAGFGGGLNIMPFANPLVEGNVFFGNRANTAAAIALQQAGNVTLTNNIIAQNVATTTSMIGGGIIADHSPARIINNTIADNVGDGIVIQSSENILIVNNILSHNVGDGLEIAAGFPTTSYTSDYNDVHGNTNGYNGVSIGAHDLDTEPIYVGAGDIRAYYHLQQSSPVRHTGSKTWAPPFDIDWEPRLEPVSMGADELDIFYSIMLPFIRK
jgi:parallel beta-helix repeat protein